jgi:hypothetical protein
VIIKEINESIFMSETPEPNNQASGEELVGEDLPLQPPPSVIEAAQAFLSMPPNERQALLDRLSPEYNDPEKIEP